MAVAVVVLAGVPRPVVAQGPSADILAGAAARAVTTFSGVDRQLQVPAPRLDAEVTIDGVLV